MGPTIQTHELMNPFLFKLPQANKTQLHLIYNFVWLTKKLPNSISKYHFNAHQQHQWGKVPHSLSFDVISASSFIPCV